jgi:arsenate reductase (thioredoxin)
MTNVKKKILFVCIENSNRSQMSEAFARMLGGDLIEAYSSGSKPSGIVNPKAIAAMGELEYDLGKHQSKSLEEVKAFAPFDAVVTMGCGDACPWMPAKRFLDWQIPDPKNLEPADFNVVRDFIKNKVAALVHELLIEDLHFPSYLQQGYTYEAFRELTINLAAAGKTTGPDQSEQMVHYTVLNAQRIKRGDKTVALLPEVREIIHSLNSKLHILVINEAWCGDGAHLLPIFGKMKEASQHIELKILLRDEQPELMDRYLTDGTKKAIPIFIFLDEQYREIFYWGSKSAAVQKLINTMKDEQVDADIIKEKQHLWYARDRGVTTQHELFPLLKLILPKDEPKI